MTVISATIVVIILLYRTQQMCEYSGVPIV